jgi:hypothetical protein
MCEVRGRRLHKDVIGLPVVISVESMSYYLLSQVSAEVDSELSALVSSPSQTVCFLARTFNDAVGRLYANDIEASSRPTPAQRLSINVKRPALRTPQVSARAASAATAHIERRCRHRLTSANSEVQLASEAMDRVPSDTDYSDPYRHESEADDPTELDTLATSSSPFVEALINLTLQSQLEAVELKNSSEMMELAASVLKVHCHRSAFN